MKNDNIVVLTYDIPHRKTYDTICLLKAKGYYKVTVYATPLKYVKKFKPLIQHRPEMMFDISVNELCENMGYDYRKIETYDELQVDKDTIILVCGAGLLPDSLIKNHRIINAHPGYIPNCRGLDALKWAIYEKQPIGATAHLLGDEVDAGEVILREEVPVYDFDTFHAVAQRVYETEIKILVESIECLHHRRTEYISGNNYEVHRRMSNEIEKDLFECFEQYKIMYANK